MEGYTIEQRVFIFKTYFKYGESYSEVGRKFRSKYGSENAPTTRAIKLITDKFEEAGEIPDPRSRIYHRSGRSSENISAVNTSVAKSQGHQFVGVELIGRY